ncbi:MAG: PorT family protein, partial [Fibromonadaceae bacterium]|nr:PorT family protein [Fibromonadaceae bacterium]
MAKTKNKRKGAACCAQAIIAALLLAMPAAAQDSAKAAPEKIAVHAFGASDSGINKALGSKLLAELAQSGMYAEIQDHHAFQDELAKSGNSGIGSIAQAARQHGADLVCAVSIVEVFGAYSITASMQKTSDSQVLKTASLDRAIKSLDDLAAASRELAAQLLGKAPPPPPAAVGAIAPAVAAAAAALPAMSVAQALGSTGLSKGCVEDFTSVFGKSGFSMAGFAKELVPAAAKTKLQLKAPFGKPKDSDMTSAGLTVGCIRTLPESPAEVQSLLKDIALKAGLDFAAGAAADLAEDAVHASGEKEEKDKSTLSFGIRTGFNFSHLYAEYHNIYIDSAYSNSGSGYYRSGNGSYNSTAGLQAGAVLDIAVGDMFHLQPGIMYIQKGMDDDYAGRIVLHYIEIPLLLSLKFSALRLNAGPYYGICVATSFNGNDFKNNDFGISMGLGFDIGWFYIGGFYDYGLTNISSIKGFDAYNRTLGF